MTRLVSLIIVLAILVIGIAIGYFNAQPVEIHYLFGKTQFPLIAILIAAFSLGVLLAVALVSARLLGLRVEMGRLRKQLREAEGELRTLRNLPVGSDASSRL